jgi:hypothetical protein
MSKHVSNVEDLDDEPLLVVMKLAQKMGVDADALIEATERNDEARRRYSAPRWNTSSSTSGRPRGLGAVQDQGRVSERA